MPKLQGVFKLKVRIGEQEFEAEGDPDLVARQFQEFRALIQKSGWSVEGERSQLGMTAGAGGLGAGRPQGSAFDHAIRHDGQGRHLSLRVLPQGQGREANAVLLLLLAHKRARGEEEVPVTRLNEALKQSGCPVRRLDRILAAYTNEHLVLKTGKGKGGKYRLTNQGLKKAEDLADALMAPGALARPPG